jgi:two-component system response regulator
MTHSFDAMQDTPITTQLARSVRLLRNRLGLSQEELAGRADLHRTYIAGIERGGRNITLKSVEKLSQALGVSVGLLLAPVEQLKGDSTHPRSNRNREMASLLLVEDNPDDVELTLAALKEAHFANHVEVVHSGEEALAFLFQTGQQSRKLKRARPDLILLDLGLPKMGGLELLRTIKSDKRTSDIPVIVLTASEEEKDFLESERLGAATYILKPVDFVSLSRVTPQLSLRWALLPASKRASERRYPLASDRVHSSALRRDKKS